MISPKLLLTALQKRVLLFEDDMRERCNLQPEVDVPLRKDYEAAREKGRTGLTYNAWRDEALTQIAVAWILAGVFVRFLEDNELIEVPFLAGGNPARHQRAQDEHSLYFRQHPTGNERDYFEHVFETAGKLPGMKDFFDRRHNPLWRLGPTANAAKDLLEFWGKSDPDTGRIVHDFTDAEWNTRFLGDLYQDLSEFARKRYALLQTPEFVEQFILDRTLTPAIQTFGYKAVRMIDPTCGSGHFLLGGFQRLFKLWQENKPGENIRVLAQKALDAVHGVDLNPNVVAIARFRLLLAALRAAGVTRLRDAPDFRLNLAAGDSLLHGSRFPTSDSHEGVQQTFGGDELFRDELKHFYESEDREELHRILGQQYHVVVGNPPYITVKDKVLNEAYRNRFGSCHRKYSLAVPFMERFFDLALKGDGKGQVAAGYVGMITSNSFMKREFGKKLIEEYIPNWDLTHIVDTSGAYIPGHGTPTVILLGKNQPPVSATIRTVLGIRGEPVPPEIPEEGEVWLAITRQIDEAGSESEWVSAADSLRANFHRHPWSIGGGGAGEVMELLQTEDILGTKVCDMGMSTYSGADDVYLLPEPNSRRLGSTCYCAPSLAGDDVRDFSASSSFACLVPYEKRKLIAIQALPARLAQHLWFHRAGLASRLSFGRTHADRGMAWYEPSMFFFDRFDSERKICHAYVATHNHFVLLNGRFATNRHAPVMRLQTDATQDDYVRVIGLLNSSTGAYWMKQFFHCKGGQGINEGAKAELWERFTEFDSTKLKQFPLPADKPFALASGLDRLAQKLISHGPLFALATSAGHTRAALDAAKQRWTETLQRMIALQEELDWECYRLYGLIEGRAQGAETRGQTSEVGGQRPEATSEFEGDWAGGGVPPLKLGERAFEIVMARKLAAGELQTTWFERHGSTPTPSIPEHWPQPYRELVQRRIALIESDRNIALIERPEYKRRWNVEPWDEQLERALREWLLNRLEQYFFGGERMKQNHGKAESCGKSQQQDNPVPVPMILSSDDSVLSALRRSFPGGIQPALASTNQLAAVVETDADFLRVAEIYSGGPGFSVSKLVRELVEAESVPFLPFQRYKDTGLRKRQDWEHVWDLQRKEDAIEAEVRGQTSAVGGQESKASEDAITALVKKRQKEEVGDIPVPPKYASGDFKKANWWKLRGKLDVPKERWIIYPGAERDADPSPVIAWAGWDHLQQAKALASYYVDASTNLGWPPEKLRLLLAGLADLLPWLKQWHNTFDPEVGSGLGDYFAGFLDEEARKQGTTVDGLNQMRFGGLPLEPKPAITVGAPLKFGKKRHVIEPAEVKPVAVPEFASFADAYPSNTADKFVCAVALEVVTWRDSVDSNDHLDALILVTHPDLCRVLMVKGTAAELDSWTAPIRSELKGIQAKGLKWVQCMDYLEKHRVALVIERDEPGRPIRAGSNFDSARQSFPCKQSAIVVFALSLLDSIKERRQSCSLSTEQTEAFGTIETLHAQYAMTEGV